MSRLTALHMAMQTWLRPQALATWSPVCQPFQCRAVHSGKDSMEGATLAMQQGLTWWFTCLDSSQGKVLTLAPLQEGRDTGNLLHPNQELIIKASSLHTEHVQTSWLCYSKLVLKTFLLSRSWHLLLAEVKSWLLKHLDTSSTTPEFLIGNLGFCSIAAIMFASQMSPIWTEKKQCPAQCPLSMFMFSESLSLILNRTPHLRGFHQLKFCQILSLLKKMLVLMKGLTKKSSVDLLLYSHCLPNILIMFNKWSVITKWMKTSSLYSLKHAAYTH